MNKTTESILSVSQINGSIKKCILQFFNPDGLVTGMFLESIQKEAIKKWSITGKMQSKEYSWYP